MARSVLRNSRKSPASSRWGWLTQVGLVTLQPEGALPLSLPRFLLLRNCVNRP